MTNKRAKARWLFVIGLSIFMFDIYLFFQPATRVQADSNNQPTANLSVTEGTQPDQPQAPTTAGDDGQNPTDDAAQPTSESVQATDVPESTAAPDLPTAAAATSEATEDSASLPVTDTPQEQPAATIPAASDIPATAEATSDVTLTSVAAVETTAEATNEATAELTQEPALTETLAVDHTNVPAEATSEATESVEATREIQPFALMAVAPAAEPDIELGVTCPSPGVAAFTLRNVGGDMPAPGQYTVSNPPSSQSFQLAAGASISFQAAGDANVTVSYTTSAGTQVSLGATGQCTSQPTVTLTPSPTLGFTLTPSNTPTASNTPTPTNTPTASYTPTITLTPTVTLTPTITLTPSLTFTPTITLTPSLTLTPSNTPLPTASFTPSNTPLPTLTFTPSNTPTITLTPSVTLTPSITPTPSATATLQPGTPLIELNVACLPVAPGAAPQARFRLRNVGGDMLTPGTYTLQEPNQPIQTQSFLLLAGATQDLIAAGDAQVNVTYSTIIFSSVSLGVTGTCLSTPTLTPTPPTPAPTSQPPPPATSAPTSVPTSAPVPTTTPALVVTVTPQLLSANRVGATATSVVGIAAGAPAQSATNAPEACGEADETLDNNFPLIDMVASDCVPQATTLERPAAWTPVSVGGAVCPDWLIYHTNMTGDWEIFRLGELPDGVEADPNLSRGVGRRVYDLMPSRSPDQMWIAFATNRDTNWEIYISAVEESDIERVTYTPDAVELDPVWSPVGGRIVYESNRNGNWNLYMFDVSSGVETRLTDWAGNEINASWSPDGKQIVFQSDGEGFWQIYELNVDTLASKLLSDGIGDDHGPQFARDGQHIVFHSLRDGDNSVIFTMNADGSQVKPISDPAGNAINHAWSPDDRFIAYQSNVDGDEDVYVYELATQLTRKLTDNGINDYAPTWYCNAPVVAFTSDITGDSNIFSADVLPIAGQPIDVEKAANQMTSDTASDQYPVDSPSEENASRQDTLPSPVKNK